MIQIAYVLHDLSMGGAERHLIEVLRHIDRRRFRPWLFCLGNGYGKSLYEEYRRSDVAMLSMGMEGGLASPKNLARLIRMARLMRSADIRLVHGYLFEGNLLGVLAGRLAGVPVLIASKRSLDTYHGLQMIACRITNRLASKVTANSMAVLRFAQKTEGCPENKMVVIPNGTSASPPIEASIERMTLRRSWGIPDDGVIVGTVARFFWKKDYPCFIRMAASVARRSPNAYFVAIGDGPLRAQMEEMAGDLGIRAQVRFLGWHEDAARLATGFDVYVCASVIEGMSNALLEAMAMGLPAVATAVGGNVETVAHGRTGFLVPPEEPEPFADAVLQILGNPHVAREMGRAGRQRIEDEFSTRRMVDRMERLYESLLTEHAEERRLRGVHQSTGQDPLHHRKPRHRRHGKTTVSAPEVP